MRIPQSNAIEKSNSHFVTEILNDFTNISEQAKEEIEDYATKRELSKGHLLLKKGRTCSHLYFLESGFARSFYIQNGKDVTSWFAFESDIFASVYSFTSQKPSFENIEILEDSILYCVSYDKLQQLYRKYPEFNLIGRLLLERYYIELEERTFSFQMQSAKERYQIILSQQPKLLQRASLGHIASYLGISQETLSRIRSNI
jgi:CRP/FNR family transcriptional regulator, anaerobic regulatory protein